MWRAYAPAGNAAFDQPPAQVPIMGGSGWLRAAPGGCDGELTSARMYQDTLRCVARALRAAGDFRRSRVRSDGPPALQAGMPSEFSFDDFSDDFPRAIRRDVRSVRQ